MKRIRLAGLALFFLTAYSCDKKSSEEASSNRQGASVQTAQTQKEILPDMETLTNPSKAVEKAPTTFKVRFKTSRGDIVMEIKRDWSPNGTDRFYNLVKAGFFTDEAFFRVLKGFVAQFGIHGEPKISSAWRASNIPDDPVRESNAKGTVSFATAGPGTRTTQLFINYGNNSRLDSMGFSPIGKITEGMEAAESLYGDYGEGYPNGNGPDQSKIQAQGNAYLKAGFQKLDYIISSSIE